MTATFKSFLMACVLPAALVTSVGAATPLTTVHPSYTKYNLRASSFQPKVGGMAFLSDGRLVVAGWGGTRTGCCPSGNFGVRQFTGKIFVLSGVTGTSPNVSVDTIATGIEDIMGLTVVRDTIYVSGGNRIFRIINADNAGPSDRIDTVFILPGTPMTLGSGTNQTTDPAKVGDSLWPVKGRSEWMYGLLHRNDTFFVAPSSMYGGSGTSQVNPFRGRVIAVKIGNGTTNKRGSFSTIGVGFRHPTGLSFGPDGALWTTETQGPWFPTNKLTRVIQNGYYGTPHASGNAPIINPDPTWSSLTEHPAAVYLPQEVNSSLNAVFSGSPGAPFYLNSGLYKGQFLMGDLEWGGVQRYFVEPVNGQYQGVGFVWMGGLESGVYRMAMGPDSMIYMGMMGESGDWNWNGQYYGLQKVGYSGTPTFEMLAIRSRAQGMEIEFTTPVDTTTAKVASNYTVQTYYYLPSSSYGGTKAGTAATLTIGTIQISADRKRVYLPLTGLVARTGIQQRIVEFTLGAGLKSATNTTSWNTKAYYTLNAISTSQPFDTARGAIVDPVFPPLAGSTPIRSETQARQAIGPSLSWKILGENLSVSTSFQGAYEVRILDLSGRLLASMMGQGEEAKTISAKSLRGKLVLLQARGEGVTLARTVMIP